MIWLNKNIADEFGCMKLHSWGNMWMTRTVFHLLFSFFFFHFYFFFTFTCFLPSDTFLYFSSIGVKSTLRFHFSSKYIFFSINNSQKQNIAKILKGVKYKPKGGVIKKFIPTRNCEREASKRTTIFILCCFQNLRRTFFLFACVRVFGRCEWWHHPQAKGSEPLDRLHT